MDFASLLSSTVPAYFVLGPLVVIIVTLVVFAARKASPAEAVVPPVLQAVQTPAATPVAPQSISSVPVSTIVPTPISFAPTPVPVPQPVSVENPVVAPVLTPTPVAEQVLTGESVQVPAPTPLLPAVEEVKVLVQEPLSVGVVEQLAPATHLQDAPQPILESTASTPVVNSWKSSDPVVASVDQTHTEPQPQPQLQSQSSIQVAPTTVQ